MTGARLAWCITLSVLVCAWSLAALFGHYVRLDHRSTLMAIRTPPPPSHAQLTAAITDYERATALLPCNAVLLHDRALLTAQASDEATLAADTDAEDASLAQMQTALTAMLACTPMDGKAWLDLAAVTAYREGFSENAMTAYRMSQTVAPGESWLAQKRLLFALAFRPLLGAEDLATAQRDLAVLGHAHPNRIRAVAKAGNLSPEALAAEFTAEAP